MPLVARPELVEATRRLPVTSARYSSMVVAFRMANGYCAPIAECSPP